MIFRPAVLADIPTIISLFQQSVRHATIHDYNTQQRQVWASQGGDPTRWINRIREQHFLLAEQTGELLGFASLTTVGYLDVLYVSHKYQRKGIATQLMDQLETRATTEGMVEVSTDASLTARPFFERRGYTVVAEQQNLRDGVILTNYRMRKQL